MICAYIRHIYACGTISPTTRCQPNISCKSTPPFTLTIFDNNCIIKYIRPHNQQFIIQIRVLITLSTNIHINRHIYIYINPRQLYNMAPQLLTLSHNPSKGENTTLYDKPHFQHLTIIHISSFNHMKLSAKDLQATWP